MNFEYGCQTTNKFGFFLDNEDADPSELLASTEKSTSTKEAKTSAKDTKTQAKGGKSTTGKPGSATGQKKPLQQQNEQKSKTIEEAKKDSGKKN